MDADRERLAILVPSLPTAHSIDTKTRKPLDVRSKRLSTYEIVKMFKKEIGECRNRTGDLVHAKHALYQLS
jgi:hypothetical protein